jgi:hypothetical protein
LANRGARYELAKSVTALGVPDPSDDNSKPYTEEQVLRWAREQGCDSIEEFKLRWIIQNSGGYWVFVNGRYKTPIKKEDLSVSLLRDMSRAEEYVPMYIVGTKGRMRRASLNEILDANGTAARSISASIALQRSYYDPVDEVFHEALCPIRNIRSVYHPEIHQWLTYLGGNRSEQLLNWVASVTLLNNMCCAVYFHGPKSTGKSLFAAGLAKLWRNVGVATKFKFTIGDFNDEVGQCPLLFADESLPNAKNITSILREIIADVGTTLRRKFLPTAALEGGIRLVMAANNDMIMDAIGQENLSHDDLQALSERVLYIKVPKEAADYLKALGGNAYIQRWIKEDLIAEHALWLRDNREFVAGNRFLVEGIKDDFHRRLGALSGISSAICEFLTKHLSDKSTITTKDPSIIVGNGELLVSAELFNDINWRHRVPSMHAIPSTTKIGRSIASISKPPSVRYRAVDGKQRTYHCIDVDVLFKWAEGASIGDIDDLKARLSNPNDLVTLIMQNRTSDE